MAVNTLNGSSGQGTGAQWDHRVGSARVISNDHLIPYIDSETADPEIAAGLNTLPFQRNIFKLLANSKATFLPFMKLLSSCWSADTAVRSSEWQMIVLRTASLLNAPYEWDVNEPVARVLRWDNDQDLANIRAGDLSSDSFTNRHRIISRMVEEMVKFNKVSRATMLEAIELLGNAATEEVLMIHGVYALLARLMTSLQVDFDPPIDGLDGMLRKYNEKAIAKERALDLADAK